MGHPLIRCDAELRLLAATGDGQVSTAAGPPAWVADALGKLEDFLLSERLQKWIPAILAVREITAELFQVNPPFFYYVKMIPSNRFQY